VLENAHRKSEDKQNLDNTTEAIQLWKEMKKIKHLTREQILLKTSIERNALGNFNRLKAHVKANLMDTGLPQLAELVDTEEIKISVVDDKVPEKAVEGRANVSDILMLKHKEANPESFFCLTPEFFQKEFTDVVISDSLPVEKKGDAYMSNLFTFPNVNALSMAELITIRKAMMDIAGPFRNKLKEWMKQVNDNTDEKITEKFMETEVRKSAKDIISYISENELLNHVSRVQYDAVKIILSFGEVPCKHLLEFFRFAKAVPDESWAIIEEELKKDSFAGKRFPVMAVYVVDEEGKKFAEETPVEDVKPVKKSIAID
jgi:hypothetical protein